MKQKAVQHFQIAQHYKPSGDQEKAISEITQNLQHGIKNQVLMGITGSGKTYTIAQVIAQMNQPTLIMAHNKTLAAQLYGEFKKLFPHNAVEYFVSYYDYYQPESYLPASDTYIEKDSAINEEIDKLRHSATRSLFERKDVIIVASVSCIYGLGNPESYGEMQLHLQKGQMVNRQLILHKLVEILYERNDLDFHRGTFRVRGDVIEIFPAYEGERAIRIEMFGDEIEKIFIVDPLLGQKLEELNEIHIYPKSHYVTSQESMKRAIQDIQKELLERLSHLKQNNQLLEAQRLEQRTLYDIEMMEEIGFCKGIENYSRHLVGGNAGEPPPTLFQYFPKDFLLVIDESHITIPQIGGMYRGDRARKQNLVDYGFRLPSALDNRPLNFEEFEQRMGSTIYVSATPGDWEMKKSEGLLIEQIIRPTYLLDPEIVVKTAQNQVQDCLTECQNEINHKRRVLITTLTKRMAEDLSEYYLSLGMKVKYLHSEIHTIERFEIIRDLRKGVFDILVGINLLREGLDLPEVGLVAVMDADKEGFLRSHKSLIQTVGRAARNPNGRALFYADKMTDSMKKCIDETNRRRAIQIEYNLKNNKSPQMIQNPIMESLLLSEDHVSQGKTKKRTKRTQNESVLEVVSLDFIEKFKHKHKLPLNLEEMDMNDLVKAEQLMNVEMKNQAQLMEFENAAVLRDEIKKMKHRRLVFEEE